MESIAGLNRGVAAGQWRGGPGRTEQARVPSSVAAALLTANYFESTTGAGGTLRSRERDASAAPAVERRPARDRAEFSSPGLTRARVDPAMRMEMVRAARQRIASGEYDKPEALDAALESLIQRLRD